jgi:hypothetical protein
MRQKFAEAGFREIQDRTAAEVTKPIPGGGTRSFSVFLMTGRKMVNDPRSRLSDGAWTPGKSG